MCVAQSSLSVPGATTRYRPYSRISCRTESVIPRLFHTSISASKRQARNPDQYPDYDALREELHSQGRSSGFISSALNFLSNAAFGDQKRTEVVDGGQLYRRVLDSKWATGLMNNLATRPGHRQYDGVSRSAVEADEASDDLQAFNPSVHSIASTTAAHRGLSVLLVCDAESLAVIARRWPPMLHMDPDDLQRYLLMLREELPQVDVTEMVRQHPRAFLASDLTETRTAISANICVLREGLAGADINAMAEQDPLLLLQDPKLLEEGIRQTRQLWDVDAAALADSDPWKLALAVRAMTRSSNALPRRF